jgi:protein-S-isoprenylcysteine O-methyltransferase Ste14
LRDIPEQVEKLIWEMQMQALTRIGAEEKLLRAHFGGGYDAYCRRTSRLFPGLY